MVGTCCKAPERRRSGAMSEFLAEPIHNHGLLSIENFRDDPVLLLAAVMQALRTKLWSDGFVEMPVPALRAHPGTDLVPRPMLSDGRYLHDAPALALRRQLSLFPKVFCLTQCFRCDEIDDTHLKQFYMLDLYEQGGTLEVAIARFRKLIGVCYSGPTEEMMLDEAIRQQFGICLATDDDPLPFLHERLRSLYDRMDVDFFTLLDRWICDEIEPLSKGKCLIVTGFPHAAEARSKPRRGTTAISERAEFMINGVEVVHLYEDDPHISAYIERTKHYGQHSSEDEVICKLVELGKVPASSAGGAVGLERLCAACLGLTSIASMLPSPEFAADTVA
jgi:lysyl-tRNA synthetase class 2